MALHPIQALDHIIDEYRDYVRSEFRAKDPELRESLERELDAPRFLAQEPFYQSHRPFKAGKAWVSLPIDAKFARIMEERSRSSRAYLHQSDAIENLLCETPRPLVVTTGTGSGKTEAFLLPVLQNALTDACRFRKSGLTAILVYPMNALATDQEERIAALLEKAGYSGTISVARYDRTTKQVDRDKLRRNPPHILLTNYMMLEYLLVRPTDRDDIFANHRCRFLVLDEVHSYRGALGTNVALLIRRLRHHLRVARHDWNTEPADAERAFRYPAVTPIGTSATIKSISSENVSAEEARRLRDEAVQNFFGRLAGVEPSSIMVLGEELEFAPIPDRASYAERPSNMDEVDTDDEELLLAALHGLSGERESENIKDAASNARLLWDLGRWLSSGPMSISGLREKVKSVIPARGLWADEDIEKELRAALTIGAALPDNVPGNLRIRAHRFIRGGWRFSRCLNPECGRLFPRGEEECSCGYRTAPLYLCRNCGAHYYRLIGNPEQGLLNPHGVPSDDEPEHMLYLPDRFEQSLQGAEDEAELPEEENGSRPRNGNRRNGNLPTQMRGRRVLEGSFDPQSCIFSSNPTDYRERVILAPARNRCLCCGATAGSWNIVSPVSLGTSAALKVLAEGTLEALHEGNRDRPDYDGKDRLLIFSDSRQDAAHQARFLIFASRYDRMRRNLIRLLEEHGELTLQSAVERLGDLAVRAGDNPFAPADPDAWLQDDQRDRIRAWEEVPLLDEVAVTAGYRGTVFNLGLVGVKYNRLDEYVEKKGAPLLDAFGISKPELVHLSTVILNEMRRRAALSRPMLQVHPQNSLFSEAMKSAQWERRIKNPQGFASNREGRPVGSIAREEIPGGITNSNNWRSGRGSGPVLEKRLRHLLNRFGGVEPTEELMLSLLEFLQAGQFLLAAELRGSRDSRRLLQVNAECLKMKLLTEQERFCCDVCGNPHPFAERGLPCGYCRGSLVVWRDSTVAEHRTAQRLQQEEVIPIVAKEHTAQVPGDVRLTTEENFKGGNQSSPLNVLACSPTLEMGIDVGGLDAVALRNVPPRPDNYAQRGGRAGRQSRVGLVIGYCRSTPHDQYFFDRAWEMISGEVPAPTFSMTNKSVFLRHLNSILFGMCEPGLSGKMVDYVSPNGEVQGESLNALLEGLEAKHGQTLAAVREAFGEELLAGAGLSERAMADHLSRLRREVTDLVQRTARQVRELRQPLDEYSNNLQRTSSAMRAGSLVGRLLGIPQQGRNQDQADDRSAGYPMRRFAEFGLLPGYEFPVEPASLRLLYDANEEEPVTVARRFGITQYQPNAQVYARSRRWKVIGLDPSSPWNPTSEEPSWLYRICRGCQLHFRNDHPRCPRCGDDRAGRGLPAFEYGGFLARPDESPVMDEEERVAVRNWVQIHPQWDGDVIARYRVGGSWHLRLSRGEEVQWLNEGRVPSQQWLNENRMVLHQGATGFFLCGDCGKLLDAPAPENSNNRAPQNARRGNNEPDPYGHRRDCPQAGRRPTPIALGSASRTEVLRLVIPLPYTAEDADAERMGLSLGTALRIGMRHLFMLDGSEVDFQLEGPWVTEETGGRIKRLSLAFIDPSIGGTGYLQQAAADFHLIARRGLDHLEHDECETACYRCLKSYDNQRYHERLSWPVTVPYLEAIAAGEPEALPLELGDIDDPRPWLEAYAEGLGSPLELKFWRLFQEHGFAPEKQVDVAPGNEGRAISRADFAVPGRRLAIYVDGASVHVGQNLRRDRYIRGRLREGNPSWRVEELRAPDLALGKRLVDKLMA